MILEIAGGSLEVRGSCRLAGVWAVGRVETSGVEREREGRKRSGVKRGKIDERSGIREGERERGSRFARNGGCHWDASPAGWLKGCMEGGWR